MVVESQIFVIALRTFIKTNICMHKWMIFNNQ